MIRQDRYEVWAYHTMRKPFGYRKRWGGNSILMAMWNLRKIKKENFAKVKLETYG